MELCHYSVELEWSGCGEQLQFFLMYVLRLTRALTRPALIYKQRDVMRHVRPVQFLSHGIVHAT